MDPDAPSVAAVWNPDLIPLFAQHLPPNVVSCSLRLVSKATSVIIEHDKKVNLSALVPEHAFARHFSSPDTLRQLSKRQRARLLTLTAASGSLANLRLLIRATARYLTGEDVLTDTPEPLLWRAIEVHIRRAEQFQEIMDAAAFAGHGLVCRWLLASGCPVSSARAACAAARGGHLGLMEELRGDSPVERVRLIDAVAGGCSLPDLTRLYQQELHQDWEEDLRPRHMASILAAAAASPTPDWQAKVSWLEALWQGRLDLSRMTEVADKVASSRLADSAERLAWLRGRGYPLPRWVFNSAARAGNMPALTYLRDTLGAATNAFVTAAAAEGGHLAALQLLHARGCPVDVQSALRRAMEGGYVAVVSWLVEAFGVGDEQLRDLAWLAVRSCSLPLLRWLHERGCFRAGDVLVSHALWEGCSEEMLEWLVDHGCPLETVGTPGNLAMLRCLERLGWQPHKEVLKGFLLCTIRAPLSGPTLQWLRSQGALPPVTQETFLDWVRQGGSLCSLKWLVEQAGLGNVDWQAAEAASGPGQDREVVEWIRDRLQEQQQQQQ